MTLLAAGAIIAAIGAIGLALGLHVTVPPALLTVAEYKAPFVIGAVLMLLGAVLRGRAVPPESAGAGPLERPQPDGALPPLLAESVPAGDLPGGSPKHASVRERP